MERESNVRREKESVTREDVGGKIGRQKKVGRVKEG